MRLWPFGKKSEADLEIEPLSPDCELPDGVMLASPDDDATAAFNTPAPIARETEAPHAEAPLIDPAAAIPKENHMLFEPVNLSGETSGLSPTLDLGAVNLDTATQNTQPPVPWGTHSNIPPELDLLNTTMPLLASDEALAPPSLQTEALTPAIDAPNLLSTEAAESSWGMPAAAAEASAAYDFSTIEHQPISPEMLTQGFNELMPPTEHHLTPIEAMQAAPIELSTPETTPQTNLSADISPLTPDITAADETVSSPDAFSSWDLGLAPPVDTAELNAFCDFGTFDPTDDPGAGAWTMQMDSTLQGFHQDEPQETPASPVPDSDLLPAESLPESGFRDEDNWSNAEEYIPESANLNSSDAAYDLNHYDDPDQPMASIDLSTDTESTPFDGGLSHLQALADQVAQNIPETTEDSWSALTEGSLHDSLNTDFSATYDATEWETSNNFSDTDPAEVNFSEMLETPLPFYEPSTDISPAILDFSEEAATDETPNTSALTHAVETHEDPMLTMDPESVVEPVIEPKGLPGMPVMSPENVLNAAFIARAKSAPELTQAAQEQPASPAPQTETLMTEPAKPVPVMEVVEPAHGLDESAQAIPPNPVKPVSIPAYQNNPVVPDMPRTPSQAINHFGHETILNEARFVKQSINNLVDRYFAQQDPDHT